MHPMAVMGILATVGGLIAAAVALAQVYRAGAPLGPVLLGNGVPLLVLMAGISLSLRQLGRGRQAAPTLLIAFILFVLTWLMLNL
ncbi:MAG: hypothetical protein L6E13_02410 [Firmicutes bacterium]|nr:hypothetical protein [Bacillota bacterium]